MSTPVSIELLTDAVVASYIHEISTRHRPEDRTAERPSNTAAEAQPEGSG